MLQTQESSLQSAKSAKMLSVNQYSAPPLAVRPEAVFALRLACNAYRAILCSKGFSVCMPSACAKIVLFLETFGMWLHTR